MKSKCSKIVKMDTLKEKGGGKGREGERVMDLTSCCNHAWQNREKGIFSQDAQNGHYSKSKYGKLVLKFFQINLSGLYD